MKRFLVCMLAALGGEIVLGATDDLVTGIPAARIRQVDDAQFAEAFFVESGPSEDRLSALSEIELPRLTGVLALRRSFPYWYQPYSGKTLAAIPSDPPFTFVDPAATGENQTGEMHFLLWQRDDGLFGVYIPFATHDRRSYLRREGETLEQITRFDAESEESNPIAFVAAGTDPYELIRLAAARIAQEVPSFRVREAKRAPEFIDLFGWCTWNAFYKDVSSGKVEAGLRGFAEEGVQLGFLIIDDGWQRLQGQRFLEFATDPVKFPNGLSELTRLAKTEFGVRNVGVWHTLQGYWQGVVTEGGFADRYRTLDVPTPSEFFKHWPDQFAAETRGFVHPEDIYRWYQDFYAYLREQDIDMVKVDNQSMLEFFVPENMGPVASMAAYQQAIQGAAATHFQGNLLNCMSNSNDVAFNLSYSSVSRNSDDFYPDKSASYQADHIYHNALNNLWSSAFVWPDWDMFQTTHPHAEYHAIARAISGGPIYISDKADAHNFDIIRKLSYSDGRSVRLPNPAQPSPDSLFVDPRQEDVFLKVFNKVDDVGMLAVFNCHTDDPSENRNVARGAAADRIRSSDVAGLSGERHVFFAHHRGLLGIRNAGEAIALELAPMKSELITISPIRDGVAVIGLKDKYLSPGPVSEAEWLTENLYRLKLVEAGELVVYSERRPKGLRSNGIETEFNWNDSDKMIQATIPGTQSQQIEIVF